MRNGRFILLISIFITLLISLFIGQQITVADETSTDSTNTPVQTSANISFNVNANGTDINRNILGTNLPAWLATSRTKNNTFINRTITTDSPLMRIPGGSWSNYYDWSNCEMNNVCPWTWGVLKPTDFINFMQDTNTDGMYTVNMNGTAKEAAALVAFFNGSVSDNTVIGTDVNGRNWGKVSDWAQLRSDHGNPDPFYIKYWEIGNEIYGGKQGQGKDCVSWGWEDVWTCDGREYVNGKGEHEGFITFRNAMRAVDSSIMVGAVGVPDPSGWTNWGNEVIEEAGDVMDFYIIHEYGFGGKESNMQTILAQPQGSWQKIKADIDAAFDQYAGGRRIPIAVTEYNLFAVEGKDVDERMSQAVNGLFLADTMGQMMQHGFDIANQWDLAHGDNSIPSRYGLMRANNYFRSPQYYMFPMWSRFGSEMLPVNSSHNAATELSVYAGRIDAQTYSVLAINKTGNSISTSIEALGATNISSATVDVVKASSLASTSVTFNGNSNPNDDLSNAPSTNLGVVTNPLNYTFQPYSVTLLRLSVSANPAPVITQIAPSSASVEESSSNKTLTVIGENFTSDCVVRWNGTNLATTFVNSTQLTAVIPANNLSLPGNATVTVRNTADNTTSNGSIFTVLAAEPIITQLVPSSASVEESSSNKTITINGTYFTPDCVVRWNGSNLATTFVSSTRLTAIIPGANISLPGNATMTVRNTTANLTSNALDFTILPADPVITQLVPSFAGVNESVQNKAILVQGNYFTDDCVVRWNGSNLATTFVSSTQLTAVIPAANISSIGSANITVYDSGEDVSSDSLPFKVVSEVRWAYLPSNLK